MLKLKPSPGPYRTEESDTRVMIRSANNLVCCFMAKPLTEEDRANIEVLRRSWEMRQLLWEILLSARHYDESELQALDKESNPF